VTVERWLLKQAELGMGARTRNTYRIALVAFGNWCMREARLLNNPFAGLPRANEATDRRRERRALTLAEIGKQLPKLSREKAARDCIERYGFIGVTRDLDQAMNEVIVVHDEHSLADDLRVVAIWGERAHVCPSSLMMIRSASAR
jgi:integrase